MESHTYNLAEIPLEIEECLYRLWYGDKYLIVKGKTLAGSVFLIQKGLAYFLAGGSGTGTKLLPTGQKEGDGKNTYYNKFYRHVKKNPGLNYMVEVLKITENGYELLKAEQIELNNTIKDKNCLNSNVSSYIPKYRKTTKSYGWIKKGHVLNFKRYLNKI